VRKIAICKQIVLMPKQCSVDDAARIEGDIQSLLVKYYIICFEEAGLDGQYNINQFVNDRKKITTLGLGHALVKVKIPLINLGGKVL
jgi:hypothetical protein